MNETRRRQNFSKVIRQRLLAAQDYRCAICGGPLSFYESHIDHIWPFSRGGTDDITNLRLTHISCNLRRGAPAVPIQQTMPWA